MTDWTKPILTMVFEYAKANWSDILDCFAEVDKDCEYVKGKIRIGDEVLDVPEREDVERAFGIALRKVSEDKSPLTAHDYRNAVHSQDACNLSGIVFDFARIMQRICNESHALGKGTDWRNEHQIARLFAEQISHLTSKRNWREAYLFCQKKAKEAEGGKGAERKA